MNRIKSKWKALQADPHMREVAGRTLISLGLKAIGAALAFSFNVAIARLLGSDGTGLYFLAFSVTAIGSVIGRVGLDNTLLRFSATHATLGEWGKLKGAYSVAIRLAILTSGAVSLLSFLSAPWLATAVFNKPELAEPLRWMSLSILPFSLLNLHAESLKGLKNIRDAMLVQGIGVPLVGLSLIYPLAKSGGVEGVALAYLAATCTTAIVGVLAWRRALRDHQDTASPYPLSDIWASCKHLFVATLMNRAILPWAPLLLLGLWSTTADAGIFGTANRVAMLMSVLLYSVNNVLAPKFAELFTNDDIPALGRTARNSALLITLVTSPVFLILILGSEWVMSLFGASFAEGWAVLSVLSIGQLVNTLTGSVNHLLIVTGNERVVKNGNIGAAVIQITLGIALIPALGALGAAIATSLTNVGLNCYAAFMVWKRVGVITIPFIRWGS
jgi:O-antigen/teichoic acid export membrane protein